MPFQYCIWPGAVPVACAFSFTLSAALMLPGSLVVAGLIEITGVVPPDEIIGAVPETLVTA